MRPYGKKKIKNYCCPGHSTQKNKAKRGRNQGKKGIAAFAKENGLVVSEPLRIANFSSPCQGCGGMAFCTCNDA